MVTAMVNISLKFAVTKFVVSLMVMKNTVSILYAKDVNEYYDIIEWESEPLGLERNYCCDEMHEQGYVFCCGMCE